MKIVGRINKDGTVSIEGKGGTGPGCLVLINKIAERLGTTTEEGLFNEYYDVEQHQEIGEDVCKD